MNVYIEIKALELLVNNECGAYSISLMAFSELWILRFMTVVSEAMSSIFLHIWSTN